MSDVSQGQGWWLASDGKWYAPDQVSADAAPAAVRAPANRGAVVLVAMVAALVMSFAVIGVGYRVGHAGPTRQHWSSGTRIAIVTACELMGPDGGGGNASISPTSCNCLVDGLEAAGVTDAQVQDVISGELPPEKLDGPANKAAAKCRITDIGDL
jgi:hypothetical protein